MAAAAQRDRTTHPRGSFPARVERRHVDLLRVSSALCPVDRPAL
ncbi:putative leader peptide [Streptomyces sp. NRRL F-5123]|nr:putative leader peptide [Streptomyces sp. NRRL F-5123]